MDRRQKEKDKILRQKKYWQVDPGTDLDAFEEEQQRKHDAYRSYVKEIEARFSLGDDEEDDEDLQISDEEIQFHLADHESIHKLKGKRRKLVTDAQRESNF